MKTQAALFAQPPPSPSGPCRTGEKKTRKGPAQHLPFLSSGTRVKVDASSPHLSSGLLWHVIAIGGLQLLLLSRRSVLPGQIPHPLLVFELPLLMLAQLHIPEKELLIRQFSLQVLKLLSLPLS